MGSPPILNAQGILGGAGGQSLANTLGQMAINRQQQQIDMNPINLLAKYGPDFMNAAGYLKVNLQQAKQIANNVEAKKLQQQRQNDILNNPDADPRLQSRVRYQQAGLTPEEGTQDINFKQDADNYKKFHKAMEIATTSKTPFADVLKDPDALEGLYKMSGSNAPTFLAFANGIRSFHDEADMERYADSIQLVKDKVNSLMADNKVLSSLAGDPEKLATLKTQYLDKAIQDIAGDNPDMAGALHRLGPAIFDDNMNKIQSVYQKILENRQKYLQPNIEAAGVAATRENKIDEINNSNQQFNVNTGLKQEELKLKKQELDNKGEGKDIVQIKTYMPGPSGSLGQDVTMKVPRNTYVNLGKQFFQATGKMPSAVSPQDLKDDPRLNQAYQEYVMLLGGQ